MERPSRRSIIRYFKNESSAEEKRLVELYLSLSIDDEYVQECLAAAWFEFESKDESESDVFNWAEFYRKVNESKIKSQSDIDQNLQNPPKASKIIQFFQKHLYLRNVIMLLITVSLGFLLFKNWNSSPQQLQDRSDAVLTNPNSKVLLTLSNGKKIAITDIKEGERIELEDGISIERDLNGQINYLAEGTNLHKQNLIHSVSTPRGSDYQLKLPDGSLVYLNAESTISYPIVFDKASRRVRLSGEAYFEIKKQVKENSFNGDRVPFFVETNRQEIQVLGTKFNVEAYSNERIQTTTLLEGSVKIKDLVSEKFELLKPGEQVVMNDKFEKKQANLKVVMAWKNGDFIFEQEPLSSILKKAERWYDIEIDCPEDLGEIRFDGIISRGTSLKSFIAMINSLEEINIHLEGRRLIVRK